MLGRIFQLDTTLSAIIAASRANDPGDGTPITGCSRHEASHLFAHMEASGNCSAQRLHYMQHHRLMLASPPCEDRLPRNVEDVEE